MAEPENIRPTLGQTAGSLVSLPPAASSETDDQRQIDRLLGELEAFLEETRAIRRFYHGRTGCPFKAQETQAR